jgi:membrane fusion protein (multidrug efflux system)
MNSREPVPGADAAGTDRNDKRRRSLLIVTAVLLVAGAVWLVYWYLHARWFVSTEDAYAGGTVVQVTAEVSGTVRTVHPRETDAVIAGESLIEFDPAYARIARGASARRSRRAKRTSHARVKTMRVASRSPRAAPSRPRRSRTRAKSCAVPKLSCWRRARN